MAAIKTQRTTKRPRRRTPPREIALPDRPYTQGSYSAEPARKVIGRTNGYEFGAGAQDRDPRSPGCELNRNSSARLRRASDLRQRVALASRERPRMACRTLNDRLRGGGFEAARRPAGFGAECWRFRSRNVGERRDASIQRCRATEVRPTGRRWRGAINARPFDCAAC